MKTFLTRPALTFLTLLGFSLNASALNLANDLADTSEDTPVIIDVLDNDQPGSGAIFVQNSLSITTAPANGRTIVSNGKVVYQGNEHFNGIDSFSYRVTNDQGQSATAAVQVNIAAETDHPVMTSSRLLHVRRNQDVEYDATFTNPDTASSDYIVILLTGVDDVTYVSKVDKTLTFRRSKLGLTQLAFVADQSHYDLKVDIVAHDLAADPSISQQPPSIASLNQDQQIRYLVNQDSPFYSGSGSVTLTADVLGSFTVTRLPTGCSQTALSNGIRMTCDSVSLASQQQLDLIISPTEIGFIRSNAWLSATSGEARTDNNHSQVVFPATGTALQPSQSYPAMSARSAILLDADNDGDSDLLLTPQGYGQPTWYLNDGNGAFSKGGQLFSAMDTVALISGDLNNDNIPEILMFDRFGALHQYHRVNNQYILQSTAARWPITNFYYHLIDAQIADLQNDNFPEVIVSAQGKSPVYTNINGILQQASGFDRSSFACREDTCGRSQYNYSIIATDINNDQLIDLVFPDAQGRAFMFLNNGGNSPSNSFDLARQWVSSSKTSYHSTALKLDGDAYPEVIMQKKGSGNFFDSNTKLQRAHQIMIYRGSQSPATNPHATLDIPEFNGMLPIDFDMDNDQDLLLQTQNGAAITLGNSNGQLLLSSYAIPLQSDEPLIVGDINGDNRPDLITLSNSDGAINSYTQLIGSQLILESGNSSGGSGKLSWVWLILLLSATALVFKRYRAHP